MENIPKKKTSSSFYAAETSFRTVATGNHLVLENAVHILVACVLKMQSTSSGPIYLKSTL